MLLRRISRLLDTIAGKEILRGVDQSISVPSHRKPSRLTSLRSDQGRREG